MTEGNLARLINQVNAAKPVMFVTDSAEATKLRKIGYKGVILIEPSDDDPYWNDRGFKSSRRAAAETGKRA